MAAKPYAIIFHALSNILYTHTPSHQSTALHYPSYVDDVFRSGELKTFVAQLSRDPIKQ